MCKKYAFVWGRPEGFLATLCLKYSDSPLKIPWFRGLNLKCDKQTQTCYHTSAPVIYMGSGKVENAGSEACGFGQLKGCLAERRFCVSSVSGSLKVSVRAWRLKSVLCSDVTKSGDSWSGRGRRRWTACGRFRPGNCGPPGPISLVKTIDCQPSAERALSAAARVLVRRWIAAIWLILPVVICLSQRLSHACLSTNFYTVKLRMAH